MTEPSINMNEHVTIASPSKLGEPMSAQIYAAMEEVQQGFGSPAASTPMANPSKHLDFGKTVTDAATPSTPVGLTPAAADDVDYNQFITDTLLWTNKVRSSFYLVTGTVLIMLMDWMMGHSIPLPTVVCHLTLAQMALNYLRHAISPKLQQKATWVDSVWTATAISKLAAGIKALAAVHDKHLSANSAHKHLLIAMSLWSLSLLSCLIEPVHVVLVLYIAAFVVPVLYKANYATVNPLVKNTFSSVKTQFDAADRRVKGGAIMLVILLLGLISTTDLIIAFFVACLFASSQMPREVEDLGKKVGPVLTPIGNTATKVGGQISRLVGGAVEKFELTPTPQKKKKQ